MKFSASRAAVGAGLIFLVWLAPSTAVGGPFKNFFRKVRRTFTQSDHRSSVHYATQHRRQSDSVSAETTDKTTVNASSETMMSGPPNNRNTRMAKRVVNKGHEKIDVPYGTPVPGKQGFVTSPFAPDSGYVDVRGIPPGTQVKDPYSGKTFLTP